MNQARANDEEDESVQNVRQQNAEPNRGDPHVTAAVFRLSQLRDGKHRERSEDEVKGVGHFGR